MKAIFKVIMIGASVFLGVGGAASAVELRMSSWLPPGHTYMKYFLIPWMEKVHEKSDGRITIKLLPQPVASPPAHLDAVRDGVVDISYIAMGYYPSRFELFEFGMLPLQSSSAEVRGIAFQRAYDKFVAPVVDEFRDVKPLGSWQTGEGVIWTNGRTIDSAEAVKGAKLRISGGVPLKLGEALGATPIVKPASEVYELMSNHIIDGVMFPAEAICAFKLDQIVDGATRAPGGLFGDASTLIINKDSYAKLSEEDRAVIDSLSGEFLARVGGKAVDERNGACWETLKATNLTVVMADKAFVDVLRDKSGPMLEAWKEKARAAGVDADAMLDYYSAQIEEAQK